MNENGRALGILLAVVTAIAGIEGVLLIRMESRVSDLETNTVSLSGEDRTPLALGDEMWEMRETVGDVQERVLVLSKAQAALKKDVDRKLAKVQRAAAVGPARKGADPAGEGEGAEASLEKTVARMLDEKLAELPQQQGGEWKPTLAQFKDTLKLSEDQTAKAVRIFDDAKHDVFQLASIRREDGTALVDEFVEARERNRPFTAGREHFSNPGGT